MMVLAIANGAARDFLYKPQLGELVAHQVSTVILLLVFASYYWLLSVLWPVESATQAWIIGAMWLLMTAGFEVALGRLVSGHSWGRIFSEYNLLAGRLWLLVPLWTLVGPYVYFRLRAA
jgi:hypothetical protein